MLPYPEVGGEDDRETGARVPLTQSIEGLGEFILTDGAVVRAGAQPTTPDPP